MNVKRSIVTGLAVACLVLGGAIAQNLTKSIQLSQDPSGPFGVDTSNGVFFSNHVNTSQPATPGVANCGTSPSLTGTDTGGEMTEGSGTVTRCDVTFARAYTATPFCLATSISTATPVAIIPSPGGFVAQHSGGTVARWYYNCTGGRTG